MSRVCLVKTLRSNSGQSEMALVFACQCINIKGSACESIMGEIEHQDSRIMWPRYTGHRLSNGSYNTTSEPLLGETRC